MQRNPSREEIESRAYEIYIEQGREDGHDQEHWLLAESELKGQPESEPERSVTQPAVPPAPQQRSATAGASALGSSSSILNPRGK